MLQESLKNDLSSVDFDYVYSSPLKRAAETASLIVDGRYEIKYDDRLKERSYGDWSGLNKSEIKEQVGEELFLSARRGWSTKPPNGESLEDVSSRVSSFLEDTAIIWKYTHCVSWKYHKSYQCTFWDK